MTHYAWDPHVELIGQAVLSFFSNLNSDSIKPYLDASGIFEVDPHEWYSIEDVLAVMNLIADHEDASYNFVALACRRRTSAR